MRHTERGENMEFVIGYIIGLVLTGILIIVVAGRGF